MSTPDTHLTPALERRIRSQVETWRRDLLNLDRRQKLVYFKHTKTASLEIISPTPVNLFQSLASPLLVASSEDAAFSPRTVLVGDKTGAEVTASCRRLDLTVQQVYADRGFWTLYLGLGMLRWVDPDDGKTAYAPVVLCPVGLHRSGTQAPYYLERSEDDVVLNPALRLHLERDFSIELPDLELDDPDIEGTLGRLRSAVRNLDGWEVEDRTVLTTFSFHKEAIYRDLEEHEASVVSHPIVQLVALGADAPNASAFSFSPAGSSSSIDVEDPPENLVSILDADSSQRACILAARAGRSFVMDGPPGTGKSQTIANIVAELIAAGRRVLFVSEKAAALDVVRDRLSDKHLGDFMLELHSHAATRKEVVKELNDALTQRFTARGLFPEADKRTLRSTREELSGYAEAMNEQRRGLDRSMYDVLGRLMSLADYAHAPLEDLLEWALLESDRFDALLDVAVRLSHAWRPVSQGDDYLWRDLAQAPHSKAQVETAKTKTRALLAAAEALVGRLRAVDENLLFSWLLDLPNAQRRLALLDLLERRPDIPSHWLTLPDPAPIRLRVAELRRAVENHENAMGALVSLVGEDRIHLVDPDACAALEQADETGLAWSPPASTASGAVRAGVEFLREAPLELAPILEDARQLGSMLGIPIAGLTFQRAEELGHLAALGGAAALPERSWLNPAVQAALDESMRVLGSVVELVNERRTAMEDVFTPAALDADLSGLEIRFRDRHTGFRAFSGAARADKKLLKTLTVSGKADKVVRSRLGEAVAWQKAERALNEAEGQHAERLGTYYQRTATDFGRIAKAITTARRAIELAGNDLNGGPLADQLGRDGRSDPRLTVIAARLLDAASSWRGRASAALGSATVDAVLQLPLDVAAESCQSSAERLSPLADAAEHVAHAADRVVTLREARTARWHALNLNQALAELFDNYDGDRAALGMLYDGLGTDWAQFDAALDWLTATRELMGGPAMQRQAERLMRPVVLANDVRERLAAYESARDQWAQLFLPGRAHSLSSDLDGDLPEACDLIKSMSETCVTDIEEWDAYVGARDELVRARLEDTVLHLELSRSAATAVVPTIEWAMLQAWAEGNIQSDNRLTLNRAVDRDARVDKFRTLDQAQVAQANVSVAASCSARRPSSMTGTSAQLIRREAQKKSRHLPIRELLARTHEIVQELKPCFMMSPLSVSQFLPGDMTFDTVIFDEASQVLPSDAVNCIYRGAQLIVAGDEKQLPPTSFFAQAVSDDDVDEELDLFESVLTSCKSALPSLPLTWHYRSQHESLITYSNYRFYAPDGDALQTFPGATFESPDLGVESYVVSGNYRRGTTRDNPIEAHKVVDRLVFHRQHHPDLSIGVVTFSSAQESAISSAIEQRSAEEPALAGLLDNHDRLSGFFVKNLENVQGDERDIVIFSVGYGPDEHGKFTMNFGPAGNKEVGWRRLNVAITRARRRVEVVSSFRASEIREGDNRSIAHLKGYLDFAARGMSALAVEIDDNGGGPESVFEEDVLAAIAGWGYDVSTQVGSAGYRIDLAVRHPERPGEYALAVECDGAAYHSAASARDRDRLRASVLRGLGWRIHRIWGISWYRDRANESRKLRAAIEAAIADHDDATAVVAPMSTALETEEVDLDAPPDWAVAYNICTKSARWTHYELGDVEARPALQDYLAKVLAVEAPVHRDLVYKRVRDEFNVGRVGSKIRANIEFVIDRLSVDGRDVGVDSLGFYRLGPLQHVRVPTDEEAIRTVAQTPPEEMDLAVVRLVRDAVSAEDESIITTVRSLFGWRRAGADIQVGVLASIDRCLAAGSLSRTDRGTLRTTSAE